MIEILFGVKLTTEFCSDIATLFGKSPQTNHSVKSTHRQQKLQRSKNHQNREGPPTASSNPKAFSIVSKVAPRRKQSFKCRQLTRYRAKSLRRSRSRQRTRGNAPDRLWYEYPFSVLSVSLLLKSKIYRAWAGEIRCRRTRCSRSVDLPFWRRICRRDDTTPFPSRLSCSSVFPPLFPRLP